MFAYLIKRKIKGPADDFKQWEQVRPLLSAGPFTAVPKANETLLVPRWIYGDNVPANVVGLSAFSDPVESAEGVTFYPWKTPPTSGELLRPADSLPQNIAVTLEKGEVACMPIAAASSRQVLFKTRTTGDVVDDYALKAQSYREKSMELSALWQRQKEWSEGDAARAVALNEEVLALNIELVALGLKKTHRATDDMLDRLGWVTSADLENLALAALGLDPKAWECQE